MAAQIDRHAEKVWIWPCSSCHAFNTCAVPGSTKGGETFRVHCGQCGGEGFEIAAPANLIPDRRRKFRPPSAQDHERIREEAAHASEESTAPHERSRQVPVTR